MLSFGGLCASGLWVFWAYRAIIIGSDPRYKSVEIVVVILMPILSVIWGLKKFDASNVDFRSHYQRMVPSMDCGLLRQGEPDIIGPGVRFKYFLLIANCGRYVEDCSFKFIFLGLSLFFPVTSHFSIRFEITPFWPNCYSPWSGFFNQHAIRFHSIIALRYPFYVNF